MIEQLDRGEFLKLAAAGVAALYVPAPLQKLLDERTGEWIYPELENGWYSPSLVTVLVRRGNAARLTSVSPEFLEDAAVQPLATLAWISQQSFLDLQQREPGRATMPVRAAGGYRLEHELPFEEWPKQLPPLGPVVARLVDA
jgi:hypothetical protein